jgi:hypothetical protein
MANNRTSSSRIRPEQIKSPIQLLAVWFVTLIAINASFLSAAAISLPTWMRAALIVAAITNVLLFQLAWKWRLDAGRPPESYPLPFGAPQHQKYRARQVRIY